MPLIRAAWPKALLRFALQACKRPVIRIMGQWTGFLAGHAVDLLALAQDVPFVFEVGFNEGPEFHGESLLERGRKVLPAIVLTSEPMIEFETVVRGFAHETRGLPEDFELCLGLIVALVVTVLRINQTATAFNGMIAMDGFANFLFVLFLVTGLLAIILSYDYLKRTNLERGEYYVLILFSVSGMMLMAAALTTRVVKKIYSAPPDHCSSTNGRLKKNAS